MILIDTSAWIEFFKKGTERELIQHVLAENQVLFHPWILGELTLGGLGRHSTFDDFLQLPQARVVEDTELLHFIRLHRLAGRGVGYVDAQILASTVMEQALLFTRDKKLGAVAQTLGVSLRQLTFLA